MVKAAKKRPVIDMAMCAGCSVCIENCPVSCIHMSAPTHHGDIHTRAVIDQSQCIGCGTCAKVCPIRAITMKDEKEAAPMKTRMNIKKLGCRVFQFGAKFGIGVLPWRTPEVMRGGGAVTRLPAWMKRKQYQRVLVVTDQTLMKLRLLDGLFAALEENGLDYVVYDAVNPNPTDENVEAGLALFLRHDCDCMVAFGGGASMDCAKAIGARVARPGKQINELQGLLKVLKPIPTIFAVPTTAGTGSETTMASVIIEADTHHKASINDLRLIPKYAVLDPMLTVGLPPKVTATTGMDALCHAVEAYTNQTYCSAVENEMSREAVRLIHDNLLRAYRDGYDLEARQNMQQAAFYAGRAFTRGSVGYVHAIGHTLGGLYGTPHGLAMSILLPHVMRAYGTAAHARLAELSDVCALTAPEASTAEKAEAFISWMEDLKRQMDIPTYPDMIRAEDIDQIVTWADKEANPLYPVPVIWSRKEFKRFILSLM